MPRKRVGSRTYGGPSEDRIFVVADEPVSVDVFYEPSAEKISLSQKVLKDPPTDFRRKLMEIYLTSGSFLQMYPINTLASHEDFLKPKYERIETITLDRWRFNAPENAEDVTGMLQELPSGFLKDPSYGLGLEWKYRTIIDVIEQIPEVRHLVISWEQPTGVDGDMYFLSFRDYDTLRRAINRITTAKQSDASVEKGVLAHNSLLADILPERFSRTEVPYKPDTIFKVVRESHNVQSFSRADQAAAVRVVKQNRRSLMDENPSELLQLRNDIELVTLETLIRKFEGMLTRNLEERQWQKLFNDNPFILTLAFGYPVIKIRDQAHVGGQTLSGSGATIVDFLVKNAISNNIALIEIKKPQCDLLGKTPYRPQLFGPAGHLTSAMNQLLDQKYELQKNIAVIKNDSRQQDIESFAIHGVLIIGRTPEGFDRQKSFELFRNNSKDVAVFTFDELLAKLKGIHSFLSEHSPEQQQESVLIELETRLLRLGQELASTQDVTTSKSNGIHRMKISAKVGVDGQQVSEIYSKISILKMGFEKARLGLPPFALYHNVDEDRLIFAGSLDEFLHSAEGLIAEAEKDFRKATQNLP